jgi:hypothetical protein
MVSEKAKRRVERKRDVVILLDSITRLGRAYNSRGPPPPAGVLSGGLDAKRPAAAQARFSARARNIEGGGLLTPVIATALIDTGSRRRVIFEEFKGRATWRSTSTATCPRSGCSRPSTSNRSGTRKEVAAPARGRAQPGVDPAQALAPMSPIDSMEFLLDKMRGSKNNREFPGPDDTLASPPAGSRDFSSRAEGDMKGHGHHLSPYGRKAGTAVRVLAALVVAACVLSWPRPAPAGLFEFTLKDEKELGRKVQRLIRARLPLVDDAEVPGLRGRHREPGGPSLAAPALPPDRGGPSGTTP